MTTRNTESTRTTSFETVHGDVYEQGWFGDIGEALDEQLIPDVQKAIALQAQVSRCEIEAMAALRPGPEEQALLAELQERIERKVDKKGLLKLLARARAARDDVLSKNSDPADGEDS